VYSKGFWQENDGFDKKIKGNMEELRKLPASDFFKPGDKTDTKEVLKVEMKIGEKYLSIVVLGGKAIGCFPNKKKVAGDNQPDFKGDGVAVWVNTKKEKVEGESKPLL